MSASIQATFWFIQWQKIFEEEKPFEIFTQIPVETSDRHRTTNLTFEHDNVLVEDARRLVPQPSLDANGFMLRHFPLPSIDFTNIQAVKDIYFPAIEDMVKQEVNDAKQIYIFDWRLRNTLPQSKPGTVLDFNDRTVFLRPAVHVHVDQSPAGVLHRIQTMLKDQASTLLQHRVRIIKIGVWRPLVDHVEDWPLAFCDGSTVDDQDLIEVDHIRKHYVGSTLYLQRNPDQKFYYYDRQGKEDVLFLKIFDSQKNDVKAPYCPHASFEMPYKEKRGGVLRQSIEVRCLVFSTNDVEVPLGIHKQLHNNPKGVIQSPYDTEFVS